MKRRAISTSVLAALIIVYCAAQTGQEVSSPNPTASVSLEPLTAVKSSAGKWGFQDKDRNYRVSPQFDRVKAFSEGLAPVALHKKFGYVDASGRIVIPLQFAYAEPFRDGLALVYTTFGMNLLGREGRDLFRRAGYIDHTGKFLIGPRYIENAASFSEGVAAFQPGVASPGNAKWGYLDKTGKWAIKPRFDIAGDFSEGLAAVAVSEKGEPQKWGYISHSGDFAIPAQFRIAHPFRDGVATVFLWKEGSQRHHRKCIDTQGSIVKCPPQERRPTPPAGSRPINH